MEKSNLQVLLTHLQEAQNIINTHFLFWSFQESTIKKSVFKEKKPTNLPIVSTKNKNPDDSIAIKQELPPIKNSEKTETRVFISDKDTSLATTTWELFPMSLELSKIHLPNKEFICLKNKLVPYPEIPCVIVIDEQEKEEMLFLEKLSKSVTRFLFPSRLVYINNQEEFILHSKNTSLILIASKRLSRYRISSEIHQKTVLNKSIIFPLEEARLYMLNLLLKQELWKHLNQLHLQNMQK